MPKIHEIQKIVRQTPMANNGSVRVKKYSPILYAFHFLLVVVLEFALGAYDLNHFKLVPRHGII